MQHSHANSLDEVVKFTHGKCKKMECIIKSGGITWYIHIYIQTHTNKHLHKFLFFAFLKEFGGVGNAVS